MKIKVTMTYITETSKDDWEDGLSIDDLPGRYLQALKEDVSAACDDVSSAFLNTEPGHAFCPGQSYPFGVGTNNRIPVCLNINVEQCDS